MMHLLEQQLKNHLVSTLPDDTDLDIGPQFNPSSRAKRQLSVSIDQLEMPLPVLSADVEHERNSSQAMQRITLTADGVQKNFSLPDNFIGKIAEVESPIGWVLRRGDDYMLAENEVKFFRAPQQNIAITGRGDKVKGYKEQSPCRAKIIIDAWEKKTVDADKIMQLTLNAVLAYFVDTNLITLTDEQTTDADYRLLKPIARLAGIERRVSNVGNARFRRSIATLYLYGEFELSISLGTAEEALIIQSIEYQHAN